MKSERRPLVIEIGDVNPDSITNLIDRIKDESLPDEVAFEIGDRLIPFRTRGERMSFVIGITVCFEILADE